jgi:hypothetical protein
MAKFQVRVPLIGSDGNAFMILGKVQRALKKAGATKEDLAKFHPSWNSCTSYAKKLHGRNSMIILGKDLLTPVSFVLCWTPMGKDIGGTSQSIRIARSLGIKVLNLGIDQDLNRVISKL